jgi:hypothetical protein
MKKFAESNDFFISTCINLLEKMINTVPRGVQLTEVIKPIAVKPSRVRLELLGEGDDFTLALFGDIRVSLFFSLSRISSCWLDRSREPHISPYCFAPC